MVVVFMTILNAIFMAGGCLVITKIPKLIAGGMRGYKRYGDVG